MSEIPQHVLDDAWLIFRNHPAGAKESWKEACRFVANHVMAQERADLAEARQKYDDLLVTHQGLLHIIREAEKARRLEEADA